MSEYDVQAQASSKRRLVFMFTLTFVYMLAELIVGYMGKSTSLVADAFHMLSDVIALSVAFLAMTLSPKKWKKSTFGWARAEVLGALVNSVFLLALCFTILVESIQRLIKPQQLTEPIWVFGVGLGGLLINLVGLCIFREGDEGRGHRASLIQNQGRLTRMVGADEIMKNDNISGSTDTFDTPNEPGPGQRKISSSVVSENERKLSSSDANSSTTPIEDETQIFANSQSQKSGQMDGSEINNGPLTKGQVSLADLEWVENIKMKSDQTIPTIMVPIPVKESTEIQIQTTDSESVPNVPSQVKDPLLSRSMGQEEKKKQTGGGSEMNVKGVFLHLLADTLGSAIVVISASISWIMESRLTRRKLDCENGVVWVDYIDPGLSIISVLLIIASTWPLLQEASLVLLQAVPSHIKVDELKRKILEEIPGIVAIHDFHVYQLAGDRIIASIHIMCHDITDYVMISNEVKELFHREGIHSTTVQVEFVSVRNHSLLFKDFNSK